MVNSKGSGLADGNVRPPKRAREDTSHASSGQQPAKRSRVSRACDQCRASRERCDGAQPSCETCKVQDRTCSYNEQPKKRGIQPNYIRTLELTLAWLFQASPSSERALSNALPNDLHNAKGLIGGKYPDATDELHQLWRKCLVNKQIDQLLSGLPLSTSGPCVAGSALTPAHQTASSPNQVDEELDFVPQEDEPSRVYANISVQTTLPTAQSVPAETNTYTSRFTLPDNAWTLLEYHFAFTHAWLPFTEKHSILKIMYSYPPLGLTRDQMADAGHAELWSIMALANGQAPGAGTIDESARIRTIADSLIPSGFGGYQVPHLKAIILRALDEFQQDRVLAAWLKIGSAVRLLLLFKLLENIGQTEKRCRHVHLAAYVVERALTQRLRTFGHFRTSYITSVGFVHEDGIDEWDNWSDPLSSPRIGPGNPVRAHSTLNALVRHFMGLEEESSSTVTANKETTEIVPLLLQNAQASQQRTQPAQIVATYLEVSSSDGSGNWSNINRPDLNPTWTLPDVIPGDSSVPSLEPSVVSATKGAEPFMAMPMEMDYMVGGVPANGMDGILAIQGDGTSPAVRKNPIDVAETASVDIFDELANLDRQESTQQSQFVQNLGFPDIDLARFFGADYQFPDSILT